MIKYIEYIKNNKLGNIDLNNSFSNLTTIKIGGKIKLLYYPNTIDNFIKFYHYYLHFKDYPLIIIGNGSNLLVNSNDYNGIVISFKKIIFKYSIYKNYITISSGVMIMDLINYLKKINIGGIEKLSYIPATLGGMIKMNASAYNKTISDNLYYIKSIDELGNINIYYKKDIIFEYRKSNIKEIILECCLYLESKKEKEIDETISFIKKNRIEKQPLDKYNAGSTFKNINHIPIWKLIDGVGLRGYKVNNAMVSEKHCNFLINYNNCNSNDMIKLITIIMEKVKEKYNYNLECEWIFINF